MLNGKIVEYIDKSELKRNWTELWGDHIWTIVESVFETGWSSTGMARWIFLTMNYISASIITANEAVTFKQSADAMFSQSFCAILKIESEY